MSCGMTRRRARPRNALWLALLAAAGAAVADEGTAGLDELEVRGLTRVEPDHERPTADIVFNGATVLTATGARFDGGHVAIKDGLVTSVGDGVGAGGSAVDVSGRWITPGLIDTHSHLGVYPSPGAQAHGDGNEATSPTTPGVWAEHSAWPQDPGLERAVAGGITALQLLPGSANLIGGRGVVVRPLPTRGSRAMRFDGAPETVKMACGENPKRVYEKGGPSTRMGNLHGQREAFIEARAYLDSWTSYAEKKAAWDPDSDKDEPKPPTQDLDKNTLVGVMQGRILPQIHCYRADDMLSMLQVADEFGWQVRSFHHAVEAYKIRDILADREVAVSTWADWWGFKLEAYDAVPLNLALLHDAGARAIVHSDSSIGIQRLNQEAAKGLAAGRQAGLEISDEEAIRWITLNPAWALGIDEVTGSLEAGKAADLVVWDGPPFSVYSRPVQVWIGGTLAFDIEADGEPWSDFELGQEVAR